MRLAGRALTQRRGTTGLPLPPSGGGGGGGFATPNIIAWTPDASGFPAQFSNLGVAPGGSGDRDAHDVVQDPLDSAWAYRYLLWTSSSYSWFQFAIPEAAEVYWFARLRMAGPFSGAAGGAQLKGMRLNGAANYINARVDGFTDRPVFAVSFQANTGDGGIQYETGIHLEDAAPGFSRAAVTNLADGAYHDILMHYDGQGASTHEEYRFWIDGSPVRVAAGDARAADGYPTTSAEFITPADVSLPSRLCAKAGAVGGVTDIRVFDQLSGTPNHAQAYWYMKKFGLSTVPIDPAGF
jgi:hypothetical protein